MEDNKSVYIGKLKFDNYNSFIGENILNLLDNSGHLYQWTVFLGNNNTGKTNLLKAVADLEPQAEIFPEESVNRILYCPIDLSLSRTSKSNKTPKASTYIGASIVFESEKSSNNISDKAVEKLFPYEDSIFDFWGFRPNQEWDASDNDNLKHLKIYAYGVTRRAGNSGISDKSEDANSASLFNPDHKLTNIEEWLFQLKFASQNGQPSAAARLELIKDLVVSEIFPEILDFRFTTTEELRNYIEYETKEGWFLFEELGYGYQTTLSWIIDLCKKMFERYPTSPNPLREPAVVLVDELDLHLHPKWQKSIVDYLTNNFIATQFIVTTHSPLLLQTIKKVNLFLLLKKENGVQIKHIPIQSFAGWSVEEILSEVMEMENEIYSERHNELYAAFDTALDKEDYPKAKAAFDSLMEILHPNSPERKILKLQLSQITPANDKA